jgi:hypothetical protein
VIVEGVRTDEVATIDPGLHPLLIFVGPPPFPNVTLEVRGFIGVPVLVYFDMVNLRWL